MVGLSGAMERRLSTTDCSRRQSGPQPSQRVVLPSSHCSPGSVRPLPHIRTERQSGAQLGVPSQISPREVSTMRLPQVSLERQSERQPSPERLLPSSQTSPMSTRPSPQRDS